MDLITIIKDTVLHIVSVIFKNVSENCDFLGSFQTVCICERYHLFRSLRKFMEEIQSTWPTIPVRTTSQSAQTYTET